MAVVVCVAVSWQAAGKQFALLLVRRKVTAVLCEAISSHIQRCTGVVGVHMLCKLPFWRR